MKKIIFMFFVIMFFCGCENDLMNTPTKRVETLMNNYITLDNEVLLDLDETLLSETIMNQEQKERYRDLLKHQYQHLSYKIKDESIDGSNAVVSVEIEVYDYSKVLKDANNYLVENSNEFLNSETNTTDISKFNDYKLKKLENVKDRVTYTLDLTLTKEDDKWNLDNLTDIEVSKIHGMYQY